MRKTIVIASVIALALSACSANQATKVGNPTDDLSPLPKAFIEQYLADHPYAKGSRPGAEFEEMFWLWFDVLQGRVTQRADGVPDIVSSFTISEEGTIVTDGAIALTVSYQPSLQSYPVALTMGEDKVLFSDISDQASADDPTDPQRMCLASQGCYDSDGDLFGDGQYYVAGFVQGRDGCGLTAHDVCTVEGEVLAEAFCHNGEVAWKYVLGDCHDGKLRDDLSDTPKPAEKISADDLCALYPVCSSAVQASKNANAAAPDVVSDWNDFQQESTSDLADTLGPHNPLSPPPAPHP